MRGYAFSLVAGLLTAGAVAFALLPVNAAQSPASDRITAASAELLVFESENCVYCFIFRRDVAPGYLKSPRAQTVPMRYIDIKKADLSKIDLKEPLTTLPTVVLMENGKETDRITGYAGPEPFYYMISRLMK